MCVRVCARSPVILHPERQTPAPKCTAMHRGGTRSSVCVCVWSSLANNNNMHVCHKTLPLLLDHSTLHTICIELVCARRRRRRLPLPPDEQQNRFRIHDSHTLHTNTVPYTHAHTHTNCHCGVGRTGGTGGEVEKLG